MQIEVRAFNAPWNMAVELLVVDKKDHRVLTTDKSSDKFQAEVRSYVDGEAFERSLHITIEAAQTLMDDLWQAGLRPTEGAGSAGAMRATERHLEDMRKLVFKMNTHILGGTDANATK